MIDSITLSNSYSTIEHIILSIGTIGPIIALVALIVHTMIKIRNNPNN